MSTFDSYNDTPFQIKTEGQGITVKFEKTSPTTARISWNIPTPAIGCDPSNQAYNGIVLTLDNEPTHNNKAPTDGTFYTSDPTADKNLHAGDKIATAMVIGALYDDKTTTSIDITGITENTPYYVSGFAVDLQGRYHVDGAHAYSLPYGNEDGQSFPGSHSLCLRAAALTDPTGLLPTSSYSFSIGANGNEAETISIDGAIASTFQNLLDEITKQVALIGNPTQSATVPNINEYFIDTIENIVYQWDGSTHVPMTNVMVEATDPSIATLNDLWFDESTLELKKWDGAVWSVQSHFTYHKDSTSLTCDDFWFTGTEAYKWNGTVWMPQTLTIGGTDPSLAITMPCNSYWFDETNDILNSWNATAGCDTGEGSWTETLAILSLTDPSTPTINDYWFDETNDKVKQWDGALWNEVFAQITNVEPSPAGIGLLWYNPDDMILQQYDGAIWTEIEIIAWMTEPNVVTAGSVWWNETNDNLYIWDATTNSWDQITNFIISETDPATAPTLPDDSVWFIDDKLFCWDGSMWNEVTFISYATDPQIPAAGTYWFDTANDKWFEFVGAAWVEVFPSLVASDPYAPTLGSFWFNTTVNILNQWNGVSWVSITYSTIPFTPAVNSVYFNTVTNTLMTWNASLGWQSAALPVTVSYNADSNCIVFTSSVLGTSSLVALADIDLFSSTIPAMGLGELVLGVDGVSGATSYDEIGIGDDGSPDERRELMDSIRAQLGYPVVDVELTQYQLDTAITAAIEALRKRSASAYTRAFFFLDVKNGQQRYTLTNKTVGFNKIVDVTGIYRMQSSYFGGAAGQGLYGQLMLQHMYHMGTFDLLSYHIISEYTELMNQMFSTHIVFHWNETTRNLDMMQTFGTGERILVDAVIERTEQEMLRDRWTKSWLERYALGTARLILGEIRGKYASLPGAGGGVSLNAGELLTQGDADIQHCYQQIDDFIVNNVEDYGIATQFVIG